MNAEKGCSFYKERREPTVRQEPSKHGKKPRRCCRASSSLCSTSQRGHFREMLYREICRSLVAISRSRQAWQRQPSLSEMFDLQQEFIDLERLCAQHSIDRASCDGTEDAERSVVATVYRSRVSHLTIPEFEARLLPGAHGQLIVPSITSILFLQPSLCTSVEASGASLLLSRSLI